MNSSDKKNSKLQIRVASGKFRGQTIACPPGEIRPMTSMCKQALFNILYGRKEMDMLDLFSGSASISIEGYSRGVIKTAEIVEGDFGKKIILQKNIDKFSLNEVFSVIISDAFNYIKRTSKQYDFIMADPPFKMTNKQEIVNLVDKKGILKDDGILVIHSTSKDIFDEITGSLSIIDRRDYGINSLVFFSKK